VVNRIRQFKLVAPDGKSMYVDLDKVNMILDRAAFDRHLTGRALANGARLHLGERFVGCMRHGTVYEIQTSRGRYEAEMIVGADGAFSAVAHAAGLYRKRAFVTGWQARCRYPGLEPGVTEIRLALGDFSWIVSENRITARIGVIGPDGPALRRDHRALLGSSQIIEDQSGMIPVHDPAQKLRKPGEHIFLIGDAATLVKATTACSPPGTLPRIPMGRRADEREAGPGPVAQPPVAPAHERDDGGAGRRAHRHLRKGPERADHRAARPGTASWALQLSPRKSIRSKTCAI
jgi:flavin-dependent dehydrogenase